MAELSLQQLYGEHKFSNFLELHQAWQKTLDISVLNRRFYKEIADWYFWAVEKVRFPAGAGEIVKYRLFLSLITDEVHALPDSVRSVLFLSIYLRVQRVTERIAEQVKR